MSHFMFCLDPPNGHVSMCPGVPVPTTVRVPRARHGVAVEDSAQPQLLLPHHLDDVFRGGSSPRKRGEEVLHQLGFETPCSLPPLL